MHTLTIRRMQNTHTQNDALHNINIVRLIESCAQQPAPTVYSFSRDLRNRLLHCNYLYDKHIFIMTAELHVSEQMWFEIFARKVSVSVNIICTTYT